MNLPGIVYSKWYWMATHNLYMQFGWPFTQLLLVSPSSVASIFMSNWTSTVEVGIPTWDTIQLQASSRDPLRQASLERLFYETWCHVGMFVDWGWSSSLEAPPAIVFF
jgi:hypothetical protein